MRPDTHTRTEADAAAYEALRGRAEDFGGGPGDQEPNPLLATPLGPDPWGDPPHTPREWPPLPTDPPF